MFNGTRIKDLEYQVEKLKGQVRDLAYRMDKTQSTIEFDIGEDGVPFWAGTYGMHKKLHISDAIRKILGHLGIKFVFVPGRDGIELMRTKKK